MAVRPWAQGHGASRGATMPLRLAFLAGVMLGASPLSALETRCGWIDNPTPANWYLTDRDGSWILMEQGAGDRNGFVDADWLGEVGHEWIETNGHYGYGCACIEATVDSKTGWANRVASVSPLPLSRCTADQALPAR